MSDWTDQYLDNIPNEEFVRNALARNICERELLQKLLKLAERKSVLLTVPTDESEVPHV